ncbi:hypothetical protein WICPIJ_005483, partial [Wickerhamomyces pijperi]
YPELTSNSTKAPSHIKTSKNTAGETEDLKSAPTQSNSTEAPISTSQNKVDSPSTVLTGNTTPKEAAPTKDIIRAHKLVISEKEIRKKEFKDLLAVGISKLPKTYWLRFSLRLLMAKAFNSNSEQSMKLRKDLIIIKILSIGLIASVNNDFEVSSRIFEADPSLLNTLIELVNLNNTKIPANIRLAASQTLDCISAVKTWSSEIVKGFGGSVSHGLLFQNLRHILKAIREKDQENINEDFNRSFFNVVTNLTETKPLAAVLISAGLIHGFSEFLTLRTDYKRTLYGAIDFLSHICSNNLENIELFKETTGFTRLIQFIGDELQFALDNPGYGGGPPKYFDVHFIISFNQAAVLRCALEFIQNLIKKQSGDSARSLFDSPLLNHVNLVLRNVDVFGWTLTTNSISIITEILNSEPTSYAVLKDSGTIDLFIDDFESFFGKSALLLTSLPNAIGAISLNAEGLEKIKTKNIIKKFFKIFRNHSYAKALVQDNATEVMSGLFDELARHNTDYKPLITAEVIELIKELPEFGASILPRPEIYTSPNGRSFYHAADEEVVDGEEGAKPIAAWESIDEAFILENASSFIGDLLQHSNTWISLIELIPVENWIPLITLHNAPFDYPYSNCMYPINGTLKFFDDENREYAPRTIVDSIVKNVGLLKDYYESQEEGSIFQKLDGDKAASDDLLNRMISANNILFAFVDIYCNPSSLSAVRVEQLANMFGEDKGVQLIEDLGKLLKRVTHEEEVIRTTMPLSVADETILNQYDEGFPPLKINYKESKEDNKHTKTSAKFKNSLQVRFLQQRIHSSIALIFNTLLLLSKNLREDGRLELIRRFQVRIADAITKIFVGFLDESYYSKPSFQLVLLNTIHYCLTDTNSDKALGLANVMYLQNGGLLKEKKLLMHHWNNVRDLDQANVDELKEITYVKESKEGITLGFIIHILVFFNKITNFDTMVSLGHASLYYEGGLDGGSKLHPGLINSSFIVQTKLFGFGVLLKLFNEDGMGAMDDEIKLTQVVVSEIVKLGNNVYSTTGDRNLVQADGCLFKVNWRHVELSQAKMDYLFEHGLTDDEVMKIMNSTSGNFTLLNKDERLPKFEDAQRWEEICEVVNKDPYVPPVLELTEPQFDDHVTYADLQDLRTTRMSFVLDQYILIAQYHQESIPDISKFLQSSFINVSGFATGSSQIPRFQDEVLNTILEFIYSFEISKEDNKELAGVVQLFGTFLKNDSVFFGCHSALENLVSHFAENLKPEFVNCDWFPKVLYCLQRILACEELADMTKPDVNAMIPLPKSIPIAFKIDPEMKEQLFQTLISAEVITNHWSTLDVTRVLFIYAREPEYAQRIIKSGILCKIIANFSVATTDSPERDGAVRASFAVLLRRCYETADVLREIINREINKQFMGKNKKEITLDRVRDLIAVLKDSFGIVLRHPAMFVEEISKRVRFVEFSEPLRNFSSKIVETSEAAQTVDADKTSQKGTTSLAANDTGIVHLILTELMKTAKEDWFSDPELTEEEKKAKEADEKKNEIPKIHRTDIHKNKHCSYMIYLLKLLVELMSSYKQSKLEFLTFSKKSQGKSEDFKPRSTSLNFLLHQLVIGPKRQLDDAGKSRKRVVYDLATKVIVAFVATLDSIDIEVDPKKVDPDMIFIRKFTVDSVHKILKDISSAPQSVSSCYDTIVSVCNIFTSLMKPMQDRLIDSHTSTFDDYHMAKTILDTTVTGTLSHVLTEVDLNYNEYFFVLEAIAGVLNRLGEIKTTRQELFRTSESASGADADEEEVEEDENDFKEETPDLFQNSTLGMYDVAEIDDEDDATDDDIAEDVEITSDEDGHHDMGSDFSEGEEDILIGSEGEFVSDEDMDSEEDDDDGDDDDDSEDDDDDDSQEEGIEFEDDSAHMIDSDEVDDEISGDSELEGYENGDYSDYESGLEGEEFDGINPDDVEGEDVDIDLYDDGMDDGFLAGDGEEVEDASDNESLESQLEDLIEEASDEDGWDHAPQHIERRRGISIRESNDGLEVAVNSESEDESDDDSIEGFDNINEDDDLGHILGAVQSGRRGLSRGRQHFRNPRFGHVNHHQMMHDQMATRFPLIANRDDFRSFTNIRRTSMERVRELQQLRSMMLGRRIGARTPNQEFVMRSTRDRHNDVAQSMFNKMIDPLRSLVFIVNNIFEPSKELHEIKVKEEAERLAKAREEEIKKLEERETQIMKELAERAEHESISATDTNQAQEAGSAADADAEPTRAPVYVTVNGRQVDISGTDIDPEFFEALPDEMREDVLTQHIRERRAEATQTGSHIREIDEAFLEALPADMRDDILHAEETQRRFSTLREQAQNLAQTLPGTFVPAGDDGLPVIAANGGAEGSKAKEKHKVFFTPLVDKYGVASLMRFIFIPQSFHGRNSLYKLLGQLSINKQTRTEVLGMLLFILKEGINDQASLQRVFHQVSIKSKAPSPFNAASGVSQTSGPMSIDTAKSGSSKVSASSNQQQRPIADPSHHFPIRATPFIVSSQVLEALQFLLESDPQLRHYFISDHEGYSFKKSSALKKNHLNGAKHPRYPLNILLELLSHPTIKDKSSLMDLLSRIIQITTRPLTALKKAQGEMTDSKKRIEMPNVLPQSLMNIVSILVSGDCSSRTFQQTISAMQNLLVIDDSKSVFAATLSESATALGSVLVKDLNVLIEDLKQSQEATDFNSAMMTKFTSQSSDQAKLLRVLTALDYLFTSKKKDKEERMVQNKNLTDVYDKAKLGSLWGALSETLDLFESNKAITHVAITLLPLIEALMVVCKHSKVKELEAKDALKFENKKCDFTNEPIESLFFSFTDTHKKILNQMVRSNSKLMSGPFAMLVRNPRVLEFDNKKNYFDRMLHSEEDKKTTLGVTVSRDQVFLDSFRSLFFKSKDEFKKSKLEITFRGESGVDAGGVTREWYQVLSRQMFNPDYALFLPVAADKTTFHPNRTSSVNPEHLSFFKFIGRVIGKAIFDNCFLDCHFSRDVYKSILGRSVSLKDLESIDLDYYKSLIWMLENDITDIIFETFSVETDDYGVVSTIDLIPNGRDVSVTEDNKQEYVRLVVEYRLQKSVKEQMDNFLQGFHEIIPKELISIFDEQELELLISGLPDIDVDDWKNNTKYVNYTPNSQEIQYFWRAVRSFDTEERAKLLQFATGTSKVPLNGFKELEGANGATKFSIHKDFGSVDRLPSSHTCFNQIDLPAYASYETLRGSLLLAITEGHEGFGLA